MSFNKIFPCVVPAIIIRIAIVMVVSTCLGVQSLAFAASKKSSVKAADLVKDGQLINLTSEKYLELFRELREKHNFSSEELGIIFNKPVISKKVLEYMDKPWEAMPYYKYSKLFITQRNIVKGRELLIQYRTLLDQVEKKFGVDREIVMAIWAIETRYGTNQGDFGVLRTLNTLFDAYPRRSSFFRNQLIHFLLLCRENNVDPHTIKGSYAGAFGQTQFIPSSFRAYAVSFDGNPIKDVWGSVPDVLASIANYLHHHHFVLDKPVYAELGNQLLDKQLVVAFDKGRKGRVDWELVHKKQNNSIPPAYGKGQLSIVGLELVPSAQPAMRYVAGYPNFIAITEWNHSNRYAMAVTELAESFRDDLTR
ncbi:MAG: lytic murein transglycosylase [Desulfobulbaceae bacterium]|nr:lytic murein transglycosylase [Desulfobulbaceae bacterium]